MNLNNTDWSIFYVNSSSKENTINIVFNKKNLTGKNVEICRKQ